MRKKILFGVVGLVVVGALALVATGAVFAQEDTPTPAPGTGGWRSWGRGFGFGHGPGGQVGLEAAAEVLGMTVDELSTQLWAGESLADLADKAGVDLQDVQDAVLAAKEQATRDAIEQAVEDGGLTRDHADWLLEGLNNGYWGSGRSGGFGFHGRHGGFGGFRGFRGPANSTAPSGTGL